MLEVFFLRFAWLSARPAEGQWALTYFGRCEGGPNLVQGSGVTEANPPIDVDSEGRIGVAPGQSFALPLTSDVAYTARGSADGVAPYLVLLSDSRGAPPAPGEIEARASCAEGALAPAIVDGQLQWQAWRAGAPWSEDAARLKSIALQCGAGSGPVESRVRRGDGRITLEVGGCSLDRAVAPNTLPSVAVVAGPLASRVDRDGGWSVRRRVEPVILGVSTLFGAGHAAILIGGFGGAPALLMLATLAAAGVLIPLMPIGNAGLALFPLLALWFMLAACAAPAWVWRRARAFRTTKARTTLALAGVITLAGLVLAAPTRIPPLARAAIGGDPVVTATPEPARCLLTGYSTAAGIDIVPRGADARLELDRSCGACRGSAARHAMPGRIFEDVRDFIGAGPPAGLAPGGTVLFWGGGNDDIFWPMLSRDHLGSSLVLSAYFIEMILRSLSSGSLIHPTALDVRRALDRSSDFSATMADEQEAAVRAAALAVQKSGGHFVYAHDFMAYDMDGGRSPARRELVARRRAAVESAGGLFIDLLDELGPDAGVAWFNDFIHPSSVGHARIAPRLCRAVEGAQVSPNEGARTLQ